MPIFIFVMSLALIGFFMVILLSKPASDAQNLKAAAFMIDALARTPLPPAKSAELVDVCEDIIAGTIKGEAAQGAIR